MYLCITYIRALRCPMTWARDSCISRPIDISSICKFILVLPEHSLEWVHPELECYRRHRKIIFTDFAYFAFAEVNMSSKVSKETLYESVHAVLQVMKLFSFLLRLAAPFFKLILHSWTIVVRHPRTSRGSSRRLWTSRSVWRTTTPTRTSVSLAPSSMSPP